LKQSLKAAAVGAVALSALAKVSAQQQ